MEAPIEAQEVRGGEEVDEGIAHIAFVFEINWEIEEVKVERGGRGVIITRTALRGEEVNLLEEHRLGILIGDVADHEGGAVVMTSEDLLRVQMILWCLSSSSSSSSCRG
jgi:hypothetical protein